MFKRKRIIAIVVSLIMAMSVMPGMAFAGEGNGGGNGTGGGSGTGGGNGGNSGSKISIKINDGGNAFDVNIGEELKLEAEVSGVNEAYHIHWEKTNAKKFINFIEKKEEIAAAMVSSDNVKIKGVDEGAAEITVSLIPGEHSDSCTAEALASKAITINVKDPVERGEYTYGAQGKGQTVKVTAPSDITQLYPSQEGQELTYYLNRINTAFDAAKDIDITFQLGSGMGGAYDEAAFIENAVSQIAVYNKKEEKILASSAMGNLSFVERNPVSRYVTVRVAAGTLKEGSYVLVFGENLCTAAGNKTLGVPVKFEIQVTGAAAQIKLDKSSAVLKQGGSTKLNASGTPSDAEIIWTSSDTKVAAVDKNGKVTAKSAGDAVITAAVKDAADTAASCKVSVIGTAIAKAASQSSTSVKVSWKKVNKADGYTVYKYDAKTKAYKAVKTTAKLSYTDKKLKTGKTYSYKVKAYRVINNKKVYGNPSAKAAAAPKLSAPATKVTAKKGKILVSWKKVSGAKKYQVYKSTKKTGTFCKTKATTKTTFNDTKVKSGKTYYYKVRASKTVDGKTVYGKFSKVVKVKAK